MNISMIFPFYNEEKTIGLTINSLRHQLNTRLALKYSNKITHTLINRFGERANKVSHIVYDSNLKYQLSRNHI